MRLKETAAAGEAFEGSSPIQKDKDNMGCGGLSLFNEAAEEACSLCATAGFGGSRSEWCGGWAPGLPPHRFCMMRAYTSQGACT